MSFVDFRVRVEPRSTMMRSMKHPRPPDRIHAAQSLVQTGLSVIGFSMSLEAEKDGSRLLRDAVQGLVLRTNSAASTAPGSP